MRRTDVNLLTTRCNSRRTCRNITILSDAGGDINVKMENAYRDFNF